MLSDQTLHTYAGWAFCHWLRIISENLSPDYFLTGEEHAEVPTLYAGWRSIPWLEDYLRKPSNILFPYQLVTRGDCA